MFLWGPWIFNFHLGVAKALDCDEIIFEREIFLSNSMFQTSIILDLKVDNHTAKLIQFFLKYT